jgi:hypothetical protein
MLEATEGRVTEMLNSCLERPAGYHWVEDVSFRHVQGV